MEETNKVEFISDYTIVNLMPGPSMNLEKVPFHGTFAQAVELARKRFVYLLEDESYSVKRVRICDKFALHTWFKIEVILGGVHETNLNANAVYRTIGAE